MQSNFKEKHVPLHKDKNCQATISEYDDFKGQSSMSSDKNCQENINKQSVTNTNNMWLPKAAVLHKYRRLCSAKNCQSTRCYKKYEDTKYDKNCQSANVMQKI